MIIACRLATYGKYQERAWTHLPEIGIHHVEIKVPSPDAVGATLERLRAHELKASSCQGACDIADEGVVDSMAPQLDACAALGSSILFLSVHAGETDRALVWERLRAIGDQAETRAVTAVLETHPDLAVNGDVARRTMEAVDHPNIKINFDTANVYYYNHDVTAHGELAKVISYVAAIHLKDTTGGFKTWDFPALGQGVVDFPRVFQVLRDAGFDGPCAMELEGTKDLVRDEAATLEYVADSVAYLRKIGILP